MRSLRELRFFGPRMRTDFTGDVNEHGWKADVFCIHLIKNLLGASSHLHVERGWG